MLERGIEGLLQSSVGIGAGVVVLVFLILLLYLIYRRVDASLIQRYPGVRFRKNSLRFRTLAEEVNARGWFWFLRNLLESQKSWRTYWSFIWVIPLGFLIVVSLALLNLPLIELAQTGGVQNGWQAQLTISSLSFIVLIFLLDQISRSRYREGVVQEFFASSAVMPVIYFTLGSSGFVAYPFVLV